jgi:uncharacterized YigZ family protein
MVNTRYLTIGKSGSSLYKVKGSKHYGYTFNVKSEEDIEKRLAEVAGEHHSARHVCYAWRLGPDKNRYRANDDGEPSNSAGKPILGQIEKYDLTNTLIAVVRYFGGTKLGVGGLIDAYRTAAAEAIENGTIVEKQLMDHFSIHFDYSRMSDVMLLIRKNNWEVSDQEFRVTCRIDLEILPDYLDAFKVEFKPFNDIELKYHGRY